MERCFFLSPCMYGFLTKTRLVIVPTEVKLGKLLPVSSLTRDKVFKSRSERRNKNISLAREELSEAVLSH